MGKKDKSRDFAAWRDDVELFRRWHPIKREPSDTRLRDLYVSGYGPRQAARQLHEDEQEVNDADSR